MMPNLILKSDVFSDISDDELVNASQDVEHIERFLKSLQQKRFRWFNPEGTL